MDIGKLSLRERKFARTKLALLNAAVARMMDRSYEAISVRELCDEAMVSEATFFNYFPKKSDLLVYFVELWAIDVAWHGRHDSDGAGGLAAIEAIYNRTAVRASTRPRVMNEIIAFIAREQEEAAFKTVSAAERLMAYPDLEQVESLPDETFDSLVNRNLEIAVRKGELPATADLEQTRVLLQSVFFGVPLVLGIGRAGEVGTTYRNMLNLIWKGIRSS